MRVPRDANGPALLEGMAHEQVLGGRVDDGALHIVGIERVADADAEVGGVDLVEARRADDPPVEVVDDREGHSRLRVGERGLDIPARRGEVDRDMRRPPEPSRVTDDGGELRGVVEGEGAQRHTLADEGTAPQPRTHVRLSP